MNQWAMELARATAKRSTCLRRQVGCVLLDSWGRVIGTGFNGVARGQPHCNEPTGYYGLSHAMRPMFDHACPGADMPSGEGLDLCGAIHAEQNALMHCDEVLKIWSCYVTTSPCVTCVKMLLNTTCHRIVFDSEYVQATPAEMWKHAGRSWERYGGP